MKKRISSHVIRSKSAAIISSARRCLKDTKTIQAYVSLLVSELKVKNQQLDDLRLQNRKLRRQVASLGKKPDSGYVFKVLERGLPYILSLPLEEILPSREHLLVSERSVRARAIHLSMNAGWSTIGSMIITMREHKFSCKKIPYQWRNSGIKTLTMIKRSLMHFGLCDSKGHFNSEALALLSRTVDLSPSN